METIEEIDRAIHYLKGNLLTLYCRRWQLRKLLNNKCIICGKNPINEFSTSRCDTCLDNQAIAQKKHADSIPGFRKGKPRRGGKQRYPRTQNSNNLNIEEVNEQPKPDDSGALPDNTLVRG